MKGLEHIPVIVRETGVLAQPPFRVVAEGVVEVLVAVVQGPLVHRDDGLYDHDLCVSQSLRIRESARALRFLLLHLAKRGTEKETRRDGRKQI